MLSFTPGFQVRTRLGQAAPPPAPAPAPMPAPPAPVAPAPAPAGPLGGFPDTLKLADKVIAVRSGSIIEGADYDATPFTMSFPFTSEEWDNAVTNLESEVSEEWEKNNTTYFKITRVSDDSEFYYGGWTQFEDAPKGTWDDDEELAAIAANAGLALFDGNEGVVPGYPDWTVTEETVDW